MIQTDLIKIDAHPVGRTCPRARGGPPRRKNLGVGTSAVRPADRLHFAGEDR